MRTNEGSSHGGEPSFVTDLVSIHDSSIAILASGMPRRASRTRVRDLNGAAIQLATYQLLVRHPVRRFRLDALPATVKVPICSAEKPLESPSSTVPRKLPPITMLAKNPITPSVQPALI